MTKTARRVGLLIALALVPVLLACLGGCGVAPGEDPVLVNAERTVAASFAAANGFVVTEKQNEATVKAKLPAVHAAAERLRRDGPKLFRDARVATKAYKAGARDEDVMAALAENVGSVEAWAKFARWALTQIGGGL